MESRKLSNKLTSCAREVAKRFKFGQVKDAYELIRVHVLVSPTDDENEKIGRANTLWFHAACAWGFGWLAKLERVATHEVGNGELLRSCKTDGDRQWYTVIAPSYLLKDLASLAFVEQIRMAEPLSGVDLRKGEVPVIRTRNAGAMRIVYAGSAKAAATATMN